MAAVVDLDHEGGSYFVVMEYVEGPSLYELFRRVREERSPDLVVPLFINVLEGLHAAHSLEDDSRGAPGARAPRRVATERARRYRWVRATVRLWRRQGSCAPHHDRGGRAQGKLCYVAPEILMDPSSADPRSDLFSVGVMMWNALTARRLFHADAEAATMKNVLDQPIPPPSTVGLGAPACLDPIVLKALQRDPNQRYQSAHELAEDLRRVAGMNGLLASPTKIGNWVRDAWSDEATERRRAVRFAAESVNESGTQLSHGTEIAMAPAGVPASSPTMDTLSDQQMERVRNQGNATPPPSRRTALFGASIGVVAIAAGVLVWQAGLLDGGSEHAVRDADTADQAQPDTADAAQPDAPEEPAAPPPPCPEDMVFVAGGKFFMGSDAEAPVLKSATPAHQVEVEPFCIDKTEVTVEKYRQCSKDGACKRAFRDSWWPQGSKDEDEWKTDREVHSQLCNERYEDRGTHPVNCVTWHQATAYCQHIGRLLPSEAQWEFAARRSDGRVYSWGDDKPDSERMNGCGSECVEWREKVDADPTPMLYEANDGYPGTAPVGSFPAGYTKEGISDLAGNVFEWTADEFRPYGEVEKLAKESPGRVIRGGAFNSFMPEFADPALRFPLVADAHSHGVGFRCAAKPNK